MWDSLHQLLVFDSETGRIVLSFWVVMALIVAGFMVGIINTLAGSGTAITYSLFMFLGLPANVANGTIRFGVIMQTLASSLTFYKGGKLDARKGLWFSIPVIIGTVLGAQIATHIDHEVFEKVLAVIMLGMIVFIFYDPKRWLQEQVQKIKHRITGLQVLLFFGIGLYGGFIHIGVGIFLIAILVLNAGYELVKANALKVFIVFLYSPFALGIFMFNHQVDYRLGLISAIGNVFGGIVASRFAIQKGANVVRWFMMVVIILFSIKLLFY